MAEAKRKRKWEVSVIRTSYSSVTLAIEAGTEEEARNAALDISGGLTFPSAYNADYEVENIKEVGVIGANHYGVQVYQEIPTTGVFSMNSLEWIHDEVSNADDLSWIEFEADHVKTCDKDNHDECLEEDRECFESTEYLIGYKENEDGLYEPDKEQEYSAIMRCDSNVLQVTHSKWGVRASLCSPCYPGQCDGNSDGNFIGYAPPPEIVGDVDDELRSRIFEIGKEGE